MTIPVEFCFLLPGLQVTPLKNAYFWGKRYQNIFCISVNISENTKVEHNAYIYLCINIYILHMNVLYIYIYIFIYIYLIYIYLLLLLYNSSILDIEHTPYYIALGLTHTHKVI